MKWIGPLRRVLLVASDRLLRKLVDVSAQIIKRFLTKIRLWWNSRQMLRCCCSCCYFPFIVTWASRLPCLSSILSSAKGQLVKGELHVCKFNVLYTGESQVKINPAVIVMLAYLGHCVPWSGYAESSSFPLQPVWVTEQLNNGNFYLCCFYGVTNKAQLWSKMWLMG